jgi:ABC-type uncharacterized transport system, permease component
MLNWISYYIAIYISLNVLVYPSRPEKTYSILECTRLTTMVPGTTLTSGIYVSLAIAIVFFLILTRAVIGYEITLVGAGIDVARYAGLNVNKNNYKN